MGEDTEHQVQMEQLLKERNRLLRDQLETQERMVDAIMQVADGVEDRVLQEALKRNLEYYDDPDTGRRRQA